MRGEAREEARMAAMIDENDEVKSKEGGKRGSFKRRRLARPV